MLDLTKKIMDGGLVGKTVWICHYNRPDLDKKPLRNIPPTKCIVYSNDDLPKNKNVYYSLCHFRPLNSAGNPLSRVISPVDNTGYRTHAGNMLYTFLDEKGCIDEWNSQVNEAQKRLEEHFEAKMLSIKKDIENLKDLKRK